MGSDTLPDIRGARERRPTRASSIDLRLVREHLGFRQAIPRYGMDVVECHGVRVRGGGVPPYSGPA